ncbi:hypothetical protein AB1Y20_009525 [Prymnesium parvum]|uniref:Auxin efflux carrier n=1 Tax=Prymnesium parvum TaxID=97485 RepID=A0AB34K0J7_PRYPA
MAPWHPYCAGALDAHVMLGILIASLRAVGCAATLASAGFGMARMGLMTPAVSKGLSHLSVKLLIPSLLFSSVVPGITPSLILYAWPLLVLPALYLLIGLLIGLLVVFLVKPPETFRLGTVAACTFGNTTGIPIVLISVMQQSLSRSVFAELADPLLFLSIQLFTFPLFQWLFGYLIFERDGFLAACVLGGQAEELPLSAHDDPVWRETEGMPARDGSVSNSYISMMSVGEDYLTTAYRNAPSVREIVRPPSLSQRLYQAFVEQPNYSQAFSRYGRGLWRLIKRVFVPPVLGVSLGVFFGLLLRQLLLPAEVAPLGWLFLGLSKLGAAAVPVNLILHGAAMSRVPESGRLPPLTATGIVVGRLVLMPISGLVVARVISVYLQVPYLVSDTFWLVFLIASCTPTANNMVAMCELAGEDRRAMSAAIFYQYCAAPIVLPGVLTLFVAFICKTRDADLP